MLEESIPAIWASMNSWLTPTVLFIVLNLMIGTIAVASGITNPKHPQQQQQQQNDQDGQPQQQQRQLHPQLVRTSSVLQRLKSINLYRYRSEDTNPLPSTEIPQPQTHQTQFHETQTHQTEEVEVEEEEGEEETEPGEKTLDEVFAHHVERTLSDTRPASGIMPKKLPKKMKKSASSKSAFAHFEEEETIVEPPRPSTVKERKKNTSDVQPFGDDEEVDAKADDFINKFKQQLKLQRLNSIIRYKEMLNRG